MTPIELEDLSAAAKINDRLVEELKRLRRPIDRERWIIRCLAKFWKMAAGEANENQ